MEKNIENKPKDKSNVFKALKIVGIVLLFVLVAALFLVGYGLMWMMSNWSNLSFYELIAQLKTLNGGAGSTVGQFVIHVILPTIFSTLGLVAIYLILKFVFKKNKKAVKIINIACLTSSFAISACLATPTFVKAYFYLGVGTYIENSSKTSDFIDTYYVDPAQTNITFPENKRNLILLTLESMEMTYSDTSHGGYFEDNYISDLTDLALENECFSDGTTLNGATTLEYTNWTMAGLFAYSSGLPFKTSLGQNNMDTQESFFPNVTNLGDILNGQGYDQTFLCGSNSSFAGRDLYYKSHGNYTVHDYYTYKTKDNLSYENQWGFMDFRLFDYAKTEIKEKSENYDTNSTPFNYTFLTVDTHFYIGDSSKEDGFLCKYCGDEFGDNQYANVISCSSKQATNFVNWFFGKDGNNDISQNVRDNTTVVLLGDHPTMSSYFCKQADSDEFKRRTYVCFINSAKQVTEHKVRTFSHFDIFPTILSSLGCTIEGDCLALGVDLYCGKDTYLEIFDKEYINSQLQGQSKVIESLLKVNPYEYAYLKRMGRLPSADIAYEIKEDVITFNVTNVKDNKVGEELDTPTLILKLSSSKLTYDMEKSEDGYAISIPTSNLIDGEEISDFYALFTLHGVTSDNTYTLTTTSYPEEI